MGHSSISGLTVNSRPVPAIADLDLPLKVTFDTPLRGSHSSIYPKTPLGRFASLNSGDYKLHVGGGGISKAFEDALI